MIFKKKSSPYIHELLTLHHELSLNNEILYCWLPSHVGIRGNEDADKAAKSVFNLNETTRKIPFTDFKPVVNKYVMSKWQMSWDGTIFNKLHQIKPKVGSVSPCRQSRREDVVLTRCRIGHTFLTNSYLLKRECQPECVPCQEPLTVKHILVDCKFGHK